MAIVTTDTAWAAGAKAGGKTEIGIRGISTKREKGMDKESILGKAALIIRDHG